MMMCIAGTKKIAIVVLFFLFSVWLTILYPREELKIEVNQLWKLDEEHREADTEYNINDGEEVEGDDDGDGENEKVDDTIADSIWEQVDEQGNTSMESSSSPTPENNAVFESTPPTVGNFEEFDSTTNGLQYIVGYENITDELDRKRLLCSMKREDIPIEYHSVKSADCGWGYDLKSSPAREKRWNVVFYGSYHNEMTLFMSCPTFGRGGCPLSPKCTMTLTDNPTKIKKADVVVVFQKEYEMILDFPYDARTQKPYRGVLWREALWNGPKADFQEENFDFEIGTHHTAGILDPHWFRSPSDLLSGKVFSFDGRNLWKYETKSEFALSVISHCLVRSYRQIYLRHLTHYLGEKRVHQYGQCGTRTLPPRPLSNAAKLISKYKFYFAFENTIQNGYVTEKLLLTLNLPILPVYYGAPNVPNITKTPSFIKASDFPSPKELALYLLHLDENPLEYEKYHRWRTTANAFDSYYLKTMQNRVAGPEEVDLHKSTKMKKNKDEELSHEYLQRRAQCCRLCDENVIKQAKKERRELITPYWGERKINDLFFGGMMGEALD